MSAITAKASRKMKKYAVLTREPRCFLGSFDFSWEQRKVQDVADRFDNLRIPVAANLRVHGTTPYYGANGIQDYVEGFTHDGEFVLVAEDGANDLKNYPVKCVNGRIWVNNHAHVLQGKAGISDNSFLAFAISQSDIESLLVGGSRAKLNAETLMSIEFKLPCLQEQYRIGEYLTQLDNLITLHQRKCALLFSPFQAFISMMFTTSTFSWEQRKLGELVDVCGGRDYKHLSEGTIPVYGTGGYMLSVNDALSYDRDAIGIGRKGTIDRPYILKAPFWTVDTLFYAIPREKVDLNFAFDIFQNIDWKKKDESTGVPSLSKTAINDIDVLAPKHGEQQTIGQFFAAIDHLITLHQRKCIFFTGRAGRLISTVNKKRITSSWEQRKLGDIGKARSGVGFPDADQGGVTGVPFFKVSDMNLDGNENEMIVANNYVTAEQIADHRWSPITELPAIFFAKVGAAVMLNRKRLCRFPFLLDNNTMAYSLSPTKWDADFAKALFGTVDLTSLVQVGALPSYNAGDVESMGIYLPSLFEQEQIGAFFKLLDNLITLHQRKPFLMKWRTSDANRNQTNRLVL